MAFFLRPLPFFAPAASPSVPSAAHPAVLGTVRRACRSAAGACRGGQRFGTRGGVTAVVLLALALFPATALARDFYLDAASGSDSAAGTSPASAWRSLDRAGQERLGPGDRLWLKRGSRFPGMLDLAAVGAAGHPVTVGAYGDGTVPPVIDAAGRRAALRLTNCRYVVVEDIELTGDGWSGPGSPVTTRTSGVLVENKGRSAGGGIILRGLEIHDIFASKSVPDEGAGARSNQGCGIEITNSGRNATLANIVIAGCTIARTGRTGISLGGGAIDTPASYISQVTIEDNTLTDIGGPGINPRICRHVIVRGNTVDRSGSSADPRMHRRGSGIWPWHCDDVLIEHNRFMHARGPGDSCGMHIDFGCRDVIVQYNLSVDNEGGFVEILGDNFNCAYRYNISVNDGSRVKGVHGAFQEGKILWFSGYVGPKRPRQGPCDCYIYNNTVYVGPGTRSCFSIGPTTQRVLVANNLFVLLGRTLNVPGDQEARRPGAATQVPDAVMTHNLYLHRDLLPPGWPVPDVAPEFGDPEFTRPGGENAADYVPRNATLVRDRGIVITPLPGDPRGLRGGMAVARDILGHEVNGRPDLGAIELPAVGSPSPP